jgi:tRNA A-37 threonylcarbamoyl transferase component Bud32
MSRPLHRNTASIRTTQGRALVLAPATADDAHRWIERCGSWPTEAHPLPARASSRDLRVIETPYGLAVVKRELPRGLKATLVRRGLRGFRCTRALVLAGALAEAGVPTPPAFAALSLPRAPKGPEGWLITRWIDGRGPWEDARAFGVPTAHGRANEALLHALADTLALLHGRGFRHRDLKASNLLVERTSGMPRVLVLDLDGLRRAGTPSAPSNRTRARDLGRLRASFASRAAQAAGIAAGDWERFLARYGAAAALAPPSVTALEAATARWAARKIARNAAAGRPTS